MTRIPRAVAAGLAPLLLFAGVARAEEPRDFCPDRPGLGTPACTIGSGSAAVELGGLTWTLDRQGADRSDEFSAGDLLVRYGLTDSLEVQIGWTAYAHARSRAGNVVEEAGGTGDILIALRQNLHNPDGSGLSIALMPYATLPAGSDAVGAGDWGAGLIVPVSYELPGGFALGLTASADAAVDEDGEGRHFAFGAVLGLDVPIADSLGATFEFSARRDRDPAGASSELLAGLSAGWSPDGDLQLDIGANFGLNRAAADLELYFGIARRF